MKSILSAAALLAVVASPALAEEAVTAAQPKAEPAVVQEIVPAATEPSMSEAQPATEAAPQSKAAGMGGHGCGSKQAVYLTN